MAISKYQILGYLEHLKSDQLRGFGFLFICFLIIFTLSGMLELTFSVYINVCALMGQARRHGKTSYQLLQDK